MMKLNIRGNKIEVTDAIKKYVAEKITRLDRYFEDPDTIEVFALIKVKGKEETIEITVPTRRFTLRAEETNDDLYAAIDLVLDKLERQIRKNKTRLNKKYRNVEDVALALDFDVAKDEEEDEKIVKRKEIDTKPMDEEEAMLQMELLNHDFFVFKNIDEECVSVMYKRRDGNYGIINVK